MKIQIIIGSTRINRAADKVVDWLKPHLTQFKDTEFEIIDLRDWQLPFFDEPASLMVLNGNYTHPEGKKWAAKVAEADGYIFITPEYNHGYSAVLKNALDYAYFEWNRKPGAFISYGGSAGGGRAVEQLRQILVELQMVPTRFGVHITNIWAAFDESGKILNEEHYNKAFSALVEDLLWWTKTLKEARANTITP